MTKKEFIDLAKRRLASGNLSPDHEGSYNDREIELAFEIGISRLIFESGKSQELDHYSKTYKNVAVLHDDDLDMYYSVLPEIIVQIKGNRGIRHVSPMKDQSFNYTIMTQQNMRVFRRLDSGKIAPRPAVFYDSGRLYYERHDADITKLLMRLVIPFSKFNDDDEVKIPSGMDDLMVQYVLQTLSGQIQEDQLSDNRRES